jgi:hypothetical protein
MEKEKKEVTQKEKKQPETTREVLDALPEPSTNVATVEDFASKSGLPATDSVVDIGQRMLAAIESAALNPAVDVTKMEALLNMQERILDRAAKMAFTRDFALMSQELPRIVKKGSVGYKEDKNDKNSKVVEAFKFALFEDIDDVVRPILFKFGFALNFSTEPREGGGLVVEGTLSHREGHSKSLRMPLALDTSGGKNNLQGMGSTSSYGRRYATCLLLNIITVGEDTDAKGDPIDTEMAAKIDLALRDKCKDMTEEKSSKTRADFLKYMGVEDIRDILTADVDKARNAIVAIGKDHGKKA